MADNYSYNIDGSSVVVFRRSSGAFTGNRYILFDPNNSDLSAQSIEVTEEQLETLIEAYNLEQDRIAGGGAPPGGGPP